MRHTAQGTVRCGPPLGRIALFCAALGLGGTGMALAAESGLVTRGRLIAETYCASCHAVGENDASPMAEAPPMRGFKQRWPVEHLAEALAEGIMVGHEAMPEFRMVPSEIDAFLAYLDSF